MRSFTAVFSSACLAVLLFSSWTAAVAQDAKSAESSGQYKIGVINRTAILKGYKKVEAEYAKLKVEVDKRQVGIDEISTRIENAKKAYEAEKDKLSVAERSEKEMAIQNEYRDYRTKLEGNQADIDLKEKTMMKAVFDEIDEAVKKIGADENYHIILEGGGRSGAVYFCAAVDMSQKIIDALNSKAGTSAEPAKAQDKPKAQEKAGAKTEKPKK